MEKVAKVDPRTLWPDEARNFTPWVASADGIKMLSEAVNLRLTDPTTEGGVGPFHPDVVAQVDGQEDQIAIIENQLEGSDHPHLGQLLTYAAGARARYAIWISPHFAAEHRRVLDWLNESGSTKYFAVQLSVLRIGSSGPAAHLQVLVHPYDPLKTPRRPWLVDGFGWHHNGEYPANEPILDSVAKVLDAEGITASWDQKLYVKFRGQATGRELRVYARPAQGRVDPVFMDAEVDEIKDQLGNAGVVVSEHGVEKYPFVSLKLPITEELGGRLRGWLRGP